MEKKIDDLFKTSFLNINTYLKILMYNMDKYDSLNKKHQEDTVILFSLLEGKMLLDTNDFLNIIKKNEQKKDIKNSYFKLN